MCPQLNHLLVVIPGIGGSGLVDPTRPAGDPGRKVWYPGLGSILAAVGNPARLDRDRHLEPDGLLDDITLVPWFKHIDGYTRLWQMLRATFPGERDDPGRHGEPRRPDATIVAFPYDFRVSVADAAERLARELDERLVHLARMGGPARVVVVAHSMGGLVARRWAGLPGQAERCRGIVTLGTPHRGAPKALDVLVNGLYWGRRAVQRPGLSAVVRAWPGLWDLVSVDPRVVAGGAFRAPCEIEGFPHRELLRTASAAHDDIAEGWKRLGRGEDGHRPVLKVVAGTGHVSITQARWDGRRLAASKDPYVDPAAGAEPSGDSTVPHWAALPLEWGAQDATERVDTVGERHGPLSCPGGLREVLEQLNRPDPPPPLRGRPGPPWTLGLDVDDMAEPGQAVEGAILLNDGPLDVAPGGISITVDGTPTRTAVAGSTGPQLKVNVTVRADGAGAPDPPVVEVDGDGRFRLVLGAREAMAEIAVRAELPGGGRLRVAERVAVVDG